MEYTSGSPKHIGELIQEQNKNPNRKVPNEKLSSVVLHIDETSTRWLRYTEKKFWSGSDSSMDGK
jgi:hypothetical protein